MDNFIETFIKEHPIDKLDEYNALSLEERCRIFKETLVNFFSTVYFNKEVKLSGYGTNIDEINVSHINTDKDGDQIWITISYTTERLIKIEFYVPEKARIEIEPLTDEDMLTTAHVLSSTYDELTKIGDNVHLYFVEHFGMHLIGFKLMDPATRAEALGKVV